MLHKQQVTLTQIHFVLYLYFLFLSKEKRGINFQCFIATVQFSRNTTMNFLNHFIRLILLKFKCLKGKTLIYLNITKTIHILWWLISCTNRTKSLVIMFLQLWSFCKYEMIPLSIAKNTRKYLISYTNYILQNNDNTFSFVMIMYLVL